MNQNKKNKKNKNKNTNSSPAMIPEDQWDTPIGFLDVEGTQLNPWTNEPYQNYYTDAPKFPDTFAGYNQRTQKLPVFQKYQEFLRTLAQHRVVFVTSGTGSGKTVMVPRFLEHLYNYQAKIIVTIPRQESVREMAIYQAKLADVVLGEEIGYKFRGDQAYTPDKTRLLFATDGLLVRRLLMDPLLTGFQAVIVDEAHERNVQIDFLLYLLRRVFAYRDDFRLIIMSAEAPVTLFQKYFQGKPYDFIEINAGSKTTFPVEDIYLPKPLPKPEDYLPASLDQILNLLQTTKTGDILAFVASSSEAVKGCRMLRSKLEKMGNKTTFSVETEAGNEQNLVLFCGQGSANMSNRNKKLLLEAAAYREEINQKTQKNFNRRVTFVTNVAESSITLEGYTYVIDNGYALVDSYDPLHLASQLKLERISRAQQIQRRGRVGRVGPGVAYYLYTKKEADKFAAFPLAQIARADLSESILNFLVLPDINTVDELGVLLSELIEPPPLAAVEAALLQLRALGWTNEDFIPFQAKKLTDLKGTFSERGQFGIRTFQASTPAPTAEALISSWENHCANEVCGIFALIDATRGGDLGKLVDPQSKFTQNAAQEKARKKYSAKEGLLTTLLHIWQAYRGEDGKNRGKSKTHNNRKRKWFQTTGFNEKTFRKAEQAYRRLRFQAVGKLQEALRAPQNQEKSVMDFMVQDGVDLDDTMMTAQKTKETVMIRNMMKEEKAEQSGGKTRNYATSPDTIIRAIASGYWIYAAYKRPKAQKWFGCLSPEPVQLTMPEDSTFPKTKQPAWVFGYSWGGFGEKVEVNLAEALPSMEQPERIHPGFPELKKLCEESSSKKKNSSKPKNKNKNNSQNKNENKKKK